MKRGESASDCTNLISKADTTVMQKSFADLFLDSGSRIAREAAQNETETRLWRTVHDNYISVTLAVWGTNWIKT